VSLEAIADTCVDTIGVIVKELKLKTLVMVLILFVVICKADAVVCTM
jgi:hypothetical protein